MMSLKSRIALWPLLSILAVSATAASAETLREALTKAYQTNPTLAGARDTQRANDENVPIARARGLPGVDLSGAYNENIKSGSNSFITAGRQANAQLGLTVPLYTGGAVRNAVRAADARIEAGRFNLRGTEADLFTAVVGAYMDVLRDESIIGLNQNQVKVLKTNLEATKDRFEVGDLTRTDVAQSEARLATAQSQLEGAEAQLISSRERYVQLVGTAPGDLEQPPLLPNLPETVDTAVAKALDNNPNLAAAKKASDAARFDIASAKSARLPRVQAVANTNYSNTLGSLDSAGGRFSQGQNSVAAGVQFSLPLFQGGAPAAQVRQAQARSGQTMEQVIEVERAIVAQTRSAYSSWRASNAVIASSEKAVAANALSLEGVKAENSVGNRSILDILNAEQELLNSKVQLVSARRNAYVAGFALLAATGQAEAKDLSLDGGALYDPQANYDRVRHKIWDWADDAAPTPDSTRTIDIPAQTPAIRATPSSRK
jgi:outer membrane protein